MNHFVAFQFGSQTSTNNTGSTGQNIDWAQLAQQWIQMRDSNTISPVNVSTSKTVSQTLKPTIGIDEKGESDMEMEDDEQNEYKSIINQNNTKSMTTKHSVLETTSPKSTSLQIMTSNTNLGQPWYMQQQHQPLPLNAGITPDSTNWNMWSSGGGALGVAISRPSGPRNTLPQNPLKLSTSHIPSLLDITVPSRSEIKAMPDTPNETDTTLDAAKRKILPAWLREGLEKMEKDKQKRLERQQQELQQEQLGKPKILSITDEISHINDLTVNPLKHKLMANIPSAYCTNDEEDDDNDAEEDIGKKYDSGNEEDIQHQTEQIITSTATVTAETRINEYTMQEGKSFEQKLNNLMVTVRTTLTELLLEVTNAEIAQIANDTLKKHKMKASTAQVIRKSALATITGKLGLAAYADSATDTETSDDDDNNSHDLGKRHSDNEHLDNDDDGDQDSEEELMNIIHAKKLAFKRISNEIEECVTAAAYTEEEKFKRYNKNEQEKSKNSLERSIASSNERNSNVLAGSNVSGMGGTKKESGKESKHQQQPEREFGETTTESKLHHSNGKRHKQRTSITRKERTTRFSDNKDNSKGTPLITGSATCSYIGGATTVASNNPNINNAQYKLSTVTTTFASATTATAPLFLSCIQMGPDTTVVMQNVAKVTNLLHSAGNILEEVSKLKNPKKYSSSDKERKDDNDKKLRKKNKSRERSHDQKDRRRQVKLTLRRSPSITSSSQSSKSSFSKSSSISSTSISTDCSNSRHVKLKRHHRKSRRSKSSRKYEKNNAGSSRSSHSHSRSSSRKYSKNYNNSERTSFHHHRHHSHDSDDQCNDDNTHHHRHHHLTSSHSRSHSQRSSSKRDRSHSHSSSHSSKKRHRRHY